MQEEEKLEDKPESGIDDTASGQKTPVGSDAAAAAYRRQAEAGEADREPAAQEESDAAGSDAEAQIAELKDLLLRKAAEFDNYRKRTERERSEFAGFAVAGLLEDILPVLDNFERALEAECRNGEEYKTGVKMILEQLRAVLKRHGLEPIEALGRQFDPNVHEAMLQEPATGYEEGAVINELQRGYMLKGRVLRPARVKVAAAPEADDDNTEGDEDDGSIEIPIN